MEKLDKLTAAIKNGTSVVDVIREGNARGFEMEGECPCGTPEWEKYVEGIIADAYDSRKAAI